MQNKIWGGPKFFLLIVNNFTMCENLIPRFTSKFGALFPIVKQVFKDMYKLELTSDIKVRLTII